MSALRSAGPTACRLHRDDYALAAGPEVGGHGVSRDRNGNRFGQLGSGPAGHLRCGREHRRVAHRGGHGVTNAVVRVALSGAGLASGIAVRLRSGGLGGDGVLDAEGAAAFPLVDGDNRPVTESAAWDHDWRSTAATVGVEVKEPVETPQTRERIRDFARARLRAPADDAFLVEVLAAESDY